MTSGSGKKKNAEDAEEDAEMRGGQRKELLNVSAFSAPLRFSIAKQCAAAVVVLALLIAPAPLLPPHRLAEGVQSALGVDWKKAYLLAAVGLHFAFYGSLGVLAAIAVNRAQTVRGRFVQIAAVPLGVVGLAVLIRSLKLGHVPVWNNAVIPIAACCAGVGLGLGLLYRGWKVTLGVAAAVVAVALWGFLGGVSAELSRVTEARLRRLVEAGPRLPDGDERFGALMQAAFTPEPAEVSQKDIVQQNRAAILALGVAIGHDKLARLVGIDPKNELLREMNALRKGTTLRGREDWARHYTLSAALAALENPLFSDVSGLLKEEIDALARGTGFSFADLAADRAGVRFAAAATRSESDASAMQARLQNGFAVDDFFPSTADLPENLTVEQFRQDFGGVGSPAYRQKVAEIEERLDRCEAYGTPP